MMSVSNNSPTLNESGICPKGARVVILPNQVAEKNAAGIIVNTISQKEREELAQIYGTVIEVGPECWPKAATPWAKPGDQVIFAKYSGLTFKGADGKTYRVINDTDIVATFTELPADVAGLARIGMGE